MPEDPVQELLVAAAGPAVNVAIAAALTPIAILTTSTQQLENLQQQNAGAIAISAATFIPALISVNIVLVLFNMIPAFPMDGGRALRAVIAMGTDRVTATEIAARLGQAFAVLLGILGLWVNFILVIIAVFVFLGAAGEAHQTKVRALMRGVRARDAMITRFETLSPDSRIEDAYNTLITTDQANFPVTDEHGNVAGVLTRDDIARAANDNAPDSTAAHYMSDPPGEAHPADDLSSVFQNMQQRNAPLMPVTEDGRVVGIITPDHLGKWMMLNATKRKS
jgi:stage IV sporulation protein FB